MEILTRSRQDMAAAAAAATVRRLPVVTEVTTSTRPAAAAADLLMPPPPPMAAPPTTPGLGLSKAQACSCAPTFSAGAACGITAGTSTTPTAPVVPKCATTSFVAAACARAAASCTRRRRWALNPPATLRLISSSLLTSRLRPKALTDMVAAAPPTPPALPFKSAPTLPVADACATTAASCTTPLQPRLVTHPPLFSFALRF